MHAKVYIYIYTHTKTHVCVLSCSHNTSNQHDKHVPGAFLLHFICTHVEFCHILNIIFCMQLGDVSCEEQDDACSRATEVERQLRALRNGTMGWNTHSIHVFHLPIHPADPECNHDQESDIYYNGHQSNRPVDALSHSRNTHKVLAENKKKKISSKPRKKPCCCCCDKCQHRIRNVKPVPARWDNYKQCFVPCHSGKAHAFENAPLYYRYVSRVFHFMEFPLACTKIHVCAGTLAWRMQMHLQPGFL